MTRKLNINNHIKVKLTDHGKDVYYHQFDEVNKAIRSRGGRPIAPSYPRVDINGYTEFQLWCFIELYGPHIGIGKENVIDDLSIYIGDSVLDYVETPASAQNVPETNVGEWIPVTERLPEKDGLYLCNYHFGKNRDMTFTRVLDYYATDKIPHFQHTLDDTTMKVTHWMPLPEPPEGE